MRQTHIHSQIQTNERPVTLYELILSPSLLMKNKYFTYLHLQCYLEQNHQSPLTFSACLCNINLNISMCTHSQSSYTYDNKVCLCFSLRIFYGSTQMFWILAMQSKLALMHNNLTLINLTNFSRLQKNSSGINSCYINYEIEYASQKHVVIAIIFFF